MSNKLFWMEILDEHDEMIYIEEMAENILPEGVEADLDEDYTYLLEDYVDYAYNGTATLKYWELNEEEDMPQIIKVEMKNANEGILKIKSRELGCDFEIKKADVYYIDEIAEWVTDMYPVYEILRELDELSEDAEIEALCVGIHKEDDNRYYFNEIMSVLEVDDEE